MPMLAYDPARLDMLRRAMSAAVDDLLCMRSDEFATAETTLMMRATCGQLSDIWLPRINEVLQSKSMSSPPRTKLNDGPRGKSYAPLTGPLWNMIEDRGTQGYPPHDPAPLMFGPERPGTRSYGQVIEGLKSGALRPLTAPLDANGRAGAHYAALSITPCAAREVGHADLTTDLMKVIDFWSDGLPIGWRESSELTILYLPKARLVNTVYTLEAYDRDTGPEPLPGLTTEATTAGYLILRRNSGTAELNVQIGPGLQDPTQSFPIISETSSDYSGVFIPDNPPDFEPVTGPCVGGAPAWTFTTSASPEVDGWGTYGI